MLFSLILDLVCLLKASESFLERKSDAFSAIPPLLSPALGIGKLPGT
jgi:hypothetical protein